VDRSLVPDYACFDAGIFVQSLCLAAHARGLGTCIMARAVRRPELLRELLPGSAGQAFVMGIALGYPDGEAPINRFDRPRAALEDLVTWAG
jgi:nitroreductase